MQFFPRIVRFQLQGRIDQKLAQQLQQAIKRLYFIKPELVAIEINSEGGSQAQAKAIIQSIYSYADKSYAPVYTFADQIVFNSALLILASGNKVFSSKYSFLGDFGYSSRRQGYKQFIENLGIDFKYIHSGEQKVKLNNFEDLKEKDVKWINEILVHREQQLKSQLQIRRPKLQIEQLWDRPMINPDDALKAGLIDHIQTLNEQLEERYHGVKIQDAFKKDNMDKLNEFLIKKLA